VIIVRKIKDPIILGLISGIAGNAAKLAGNMVNRYLFKFSEATYPEIAAGIFMSKKERGKRTGLAVGAIADFVIGAGLGVPIVYLLKQTLRDNTLLKGIGAGHAAWIAAYGALGRAFGSRGVFPLDAGTNLSAFINHAWYGAVTRS